MRFPETWHGLQEYGKTTGRLRKGPRGSKCIFPGLGTGNGKTTGKIINYGAKAHLDLERATGRLREDFRNLATYTHR